jgi:hypothetical protein
MKTHILTGLVIAGVLATSAVQAASSSNESVEALYSGLSAGQVQQIHKASEMQAVARKSTCAWHEAKSMVIDQLYAAYPGSEKNFGEKDYLAASNQNFVC